MHCDVTILTDYTNSCDRNA